MIKSMLSTTGHANETAHGARPRTFKREPQRFSAAEQSDSVDEVDHGYTGTVKSLDKVNPACGIATDNSSYNHRHITENERFVQEHVALRKCARPNDIETDSGTSRRPRGQFTLNNTFSEFNSRLSSFPEDWNDKVPVTKEELAKYGWVYTGRDDIVYCFDCRVEMRNLKIGNSALTRHKILNRNCIFLNSVVRDILTSPAQQSTVVIKTKPRVVDVISTACESALQLGYTRPVVIATAVRLNQNSKYSV